MSPQDYLLSVEKEGGGGGKGESFFFGAYISNWEEPTWGIYLGGCRDARYRRKRGTGYSGGRKVKGPAASK